MSGIRQNLKNKITKKKKNKTNIQWTGSTEIGEKVSSWNGTGYVVVLVYTESNDWNNKIKNSDIGKNLKGFVISRVFFFYCSQGIPEINKNNADVSSNFVGFYFFKCLVKFFRI